MTTPPTIAAWLASRGPLLQRLDSRADWEAARSAGHRIGGSDVATLLGIGFESPWSLWLRAQGHEAPGGSKAQLFAEGHVWEPFILELYAEATGSAVHPMADTLCIDPVDPWAVGSLDALVWGDRHQGPRGQVVPGEPSQEVIGIVDAKTDRTGEHIRASGAIDRWGDDSEDLLSPIYASQMYHYLEITGLPWCDVAAVCLPPWTITEGADLLDAAASLSEHPPGLQRMLARLRERAAKALRVVRVMRDPAMQGTIRREVGKRRQAWLIDGQEPPKDWSPACRRGVADPGNKAVKRATYEQAEAAAAIVRGRRELKARDRALRTEENEFISRMNARKLTGAGWSVTQTKNRQLRMSGI